VEFDKSKMVITKVEMIMNRAGYSVTGKRRIKYCILHGFLALDTLPSKDHYEEF